ncbi:hypothetical protein DH2020_002393 [Rehmannia glutinosa]|uniref:Retrotransposon gag domain-containing protein n=1 Tax=Rehmannia glutinosa TaxID=99300 RepID=A0ABR0XTK6_REHGL
MVERLHETLLENRVVVVRLRKVEANLIKLILVDTPQAFFVCVLSPTRELAIQIVEQFEALRSRIGVKCAMLVTYKEIWDSLEINFTSQSKAKIMQQKLQLQNTRKGNLSMREYLNRVKICCDNLAAAGEKMSEDNQMVSIASRIEPCSLREVNALLLSFESRLESQENLQFQINMDGSAPTVNLTSQTPGNRRGGFTIGGRGRSGNHPHGYRGGRGNFRGGINRGRAGRFNYGRGIACQICHKTNHTADKCFYRADLHYTPDGFAAASQNFQFYNV